MPLGARQFGARKAVAAALLLVGLSACDDRWSRLDPPRLVQLSCRTAVAEATMVLVIDTGLSRVTWANAPGGPEGAATVTKQAYWLRFDRSEQAPAWEATVRRYDGVMEREAGAAPFLAGATSKAGNKREIWRCVSEKAGPKL